MKLPQFIGISGVWMTVPVAEILTILIVVFLFKKDSIKTTNKLMKA